MNESQFNMNCTGFTIEDLKFFNTETKKHHSTHMCCNHSGRLAILDLSESVLKSFSTTLLLFSHWDITNGVSCWVEY